jgi:hypothetical protein
MELYDRIVQEHPALEPRMAFLTGGAFTPRAREFAERMVGRVLEKPVDGAELITFIAEQLARSGRRGPGR